MTLDQRPEAREAATQSSEWKALRSTVRVTAPNRKNSFFSLKSKYLKERAFKVWYATLIVAVCYKLRQVLPGSDDALIFGTTARAVGAARAAAGHKGGEDRTLWPALSRSGVQNQVLSPASAVPIKRLGEYRLSDKVPCFSGFSNTSISQREN